MRERSVRNSYYILHDKLDVRKNFAGSTTKADARSVCGSSLFTRKYIIAQAKVSNAYSCLYISSMDYGTGI